MWHVWISRLPYQITTPHPWDSLQIPYSGSLVLWGCKHHLSLYLFVATIFHMTYIYSKYRQPHWMESINKHLTIPKKQNKTNKTKSQVVKNCKSLLLADPLQLKEWSHFNIFLKSEINQLPFIAKCFLSDCTVMDQSGCIKAFQFDQAGIT